MEPHLQPITGEQFPLASFNVEDGAHLDISVNGFWGGSCERTFLDVKVFNPYAPSNCSTTPTGIYRQHQNMKKRTYEARIREIEHATFAPLVFLPQEGWLMNLVHSTNAWHPCYVRSGLTHMPL